MSAAGGRDVKMDDMIHREGDVCYAIPAHQRQQDGPPGWNHDHSDDPVMVPPTEGGGMHKCTCGAIYIEHDEQVVEQDGISHRVNDFCFKTEGVIGGQIQQCVCGLATIQAGYLSVNAFGIRHRLDGPCHSIEEPSVLVGSTRDAPEDWTQASSHIHFETANLGLASTEELMREVIARTVGRVEATDMEWRWNVECAVVLAEILGKMPAPLREYRTVNSQ